MDSIVKASANLFRLALVVAACGLLLLIDGVLVATAAAAAPSPASAAAQVAPPALPASGLLELAPPRAGSVGGSVNLHSGHRHYELRSSPGPTPFEPSPGPKACDERGHVAPDSTHGHAQGIADLVACGNPA